MNAFIPLQSLYGHWVKCSEIFESAKIIRSDTSKLELPDDLSQLHPLFICFNRLAVAYGLLYVVVEGYRELNLEDKDIDKLLSNTEYVGKLRLFRNSLFHFQKHPVSKKFWEFILIPDSEKWVHQLKKSFGKYFSTKLHISESLESFKKSFSR